MTLAVALRQGTQLLENAHVAAPRLTAEVLLAHAVRRDRVYLYAHSDEELSQLAWIHYGRYLHERIGGKPTQYITRRQEFYGREFRVTSDVLIPRPETEHVVEAALAHITQGSVVIDAGTGSGAIAITLALESPARVFGTDISSAALHVAAENARALHADVGLVQCDLLAAIAAQSADVVVSNPPYVPENEAAGLQREVREWEPRVALFAGPHGTEIYARLIADAARVLRPGGRLVLELGYNSLQPVRDMLDSRWLDVDARPDLAGIPRALVARLSPEPR